MFSRFRKLSIVGARRVAPRRITRRRIARRRIAVESLETRLALAAEPLAIDDSVGTPIEVAVDFDIISNDLPGDDGDPIDPGTIDIQTAPMHGVIAIDPDTGIISYTPDKFFVGTDSFTYTVRDISTAGMAEERFQIVDPSNGTTPGSVWKYLDDGSNQGTAWSASDFDDSAWQSGPSQLGYGDGDEETVLRCGPTAPTCNANNFITSYYRHKFQLTDLATITDMDVFFRFDDGLLSYVNGQPFRRAGLLFGAPYDAFADPRGQTENEFVPTDLDPAEITDLFDEGENTIAVELHQESQTSSDASFDLAVFIDRLVPAGRLSNTATVTINVVNPQPLASSDSAQTPRGEPVAIDVLENDIPGYTNDPLNPASVQVVTSPAHGTTQINPQTGAVTYTPDPGYVGNDTFSYRVQDTSAENGFIHTMLLPRGSDWKYLDTGPANPDPAWNSPTFDDSSWASGPAKLGYGEGDEATLINCGPSAPTCNQGNFITSYFRRTIDIADLAAVDRLNILLRRDDGAVIYINGQEVLRDAMPVGTVLPTTLSTGAIDDGADYALHEIGAQALAGVLVPGQNTVAVEIHQVGSTSSDVSFDLELIATELFGPGNPSNVTSVDVTITSVTSTLCTQADLSGDGQIGSADFARLVRNYGAKNVAAGSNGDLNNDGQLGLRDVRLMQGLMGQNCAGGSPVAAPGAAVVEASAQPRRARAPLRALAAPAVDRAVAALGEDTTHVPREQTSAPTDSPAPRARLRASRQPSANRTTPATTAPVGL